MAVNAAVPLALQQFLQAPTPHAWLDAAERRLPELLLDHANCELKAASTALAFIYRYPEATHLCAGMSRLAREELRHFEQVRALLDKRGVPFRRLSASRYAGGLREAVRAAEPGRLADLLIVGALIEARSCERFAALVPRLPRDIGRLYARLLAAEARHFEHYLAYAREACANGAEFGQRSDLLRKLENELIAAPDSCFRFLSGVPPTG